MQMHARRHNLTFIFHEIIKAAQSGHGGHASMLSRLLPAPELMPPAARDLYRVFMGQYGSMLRENESRESPVPEWPKISVITPSFNQGKYIEETISSVLRQGYPNLEYIVIDGGSTDETVSVIQKYSDHISYWVSEKDRGQSDAINKGFSRATGEVITWLNSDDQFADDALFHMALAFMTSDADMVAGICEVHENGKLKHRHLTSCGDEALPVADILELDKGWNAGQFFFQPEVFFKKELWDRAGSHVREDCFYSMDYELWCRFAALGAKLKVIGVPIVNFRAHPEQKTADPQKFRAELVTVQKTFVDHWLDGNAPVLERPKQSYKKRPKIVLINDHGFRYGAGIAHQRIAAAFDLAGYEVEALCIKDYLRETPSLKDVIQAILSDLSAASPDVVIFGNLHSQWKMDADLVFEVQKTYTTYWLTHDFWLFTGRCPYVGSCTKYLTGCDHTCPTAGEYPVLAPELIEGAWSRKRGFLSRSSNLTILANSDWAASFSRSYLATFENTVSVEKINLGVPVNQFYPTDRAEAKRKKRISPNSFTIAFSVSSISEARKGADILEAALHILCDEDITLLLIGNCDESLDLPDLNCVKLGYVESTDVLLEAMNAADVFVGPSREETLGQVFLEAAMCGTPSIGFAGSGVEDAIVDGVTGLIVRERSAVHLAATILQLVRDRDYLAHLSRTSYLHAKNHFSLESSFRSFFLLFKKQGLIDGWTMPHKISFQHRSRFTSKTSWSVLKGVSLMEGPYPEYGIDHTLRWCHGNQIAIVIRDRDATSAVISCKNHIFKQQGITFRCEGQDLASVQLSRYERKDVRVELPQRSHTELVIELVPEVILTEPDASNRFLAFMLVDVNVDS